MTYIWEGDKQTAIFDTESNPNYWAIGFKCVATGRVRVFELREGRPLDRASIAKIMKNWRVVGFNSINYDLPIITYAMSGASTEELWAATQEIIEGAMRPWVFYPTFSLEEPTFIDHIDLIEVAPGQSGLKLYSGRMHSRRMQELPFEPGTVLTVEQMDRTRDYLANDLQNTLDLYNELLPQIRLRQEMSTEYGLDLRSKSDAQIGEQVVKVSVERATGRRIYRPDSFPRPFFYTPPDYIEFQTPELQLLLHNLRTKKFVVNQGTGYVVEPDYLQDAEIRIGNGVYRVGIGGLHSSEKSVSWYADDDYMLIDRDVTSYYPSLILKSGKEPANMRGYFANVYQGLLDGRVEAKRRMQMAKAALKKPDLSDAEREKWQRELKSAASKSDGNKISLNGIFGKTSNPYSVVYAPEMMIGTTIGGQLSVLMLIEWLEMDGFEVISANTDGFVTRVRRDRYADFLAHIWDWEVATGLNTEETQYRSIHSRDVNNYIAIMTDGSVKAIGSYRAAGPGQPGAMGLKKNPQMSICAMAAIAWLKEGKAIEETIRECRDIRLFVTIRTVKGGAIWQYNDTPIGKHIRFYYAKGFGGAAIHYAMNGNTVPKTDGAKPLMELPDEFPEDVDYNAYIREAYAILEEVGLDVPDPALVGRTEQFIGRHPDKKTWHMIDPTTGVALCGAGRLSLREEWVESRRVPPGLNLCARCRRSIEI